MSEKPIVCGFCGKTPTLAILRWPRGSDRFVWCIQCTFCGAHGPNHANADEAERMWNDGKYDRLVSWDK